MKRGWRGNEKSPSRDHHESCLGGFSKYSTCVHACTHAHAHAPQFGLTRERPGGSGCRARPREPRHGRGLALPLAWSLCTRPRARRLRSQSQRSPHTHSWHGPGRAGAWGAPSRSTHGGPEWPAGVVTTQLPISPLPQQGPRPADGTLPTRTAPPTFFENIIFDFSIFNTPFSKRITIYRFLLSLGVSVVCCLSLYK